MDKIQCSRFRFMVMKSRCVAFKINFPDIDITLNSDNLSLRAISFSRTFQNFPQFLWKNSTLNNTTFNNVQLIGYRIKSEKDLYGRTKLHYFCFITVLKHSLWYSKTINIIHISQNRIILKNNICRMKVRIRR